MAASTATRSSVKTADDKADPAKASEAMKTLIETDHAIAIVGQYAGRDVVGVAARSPTLRPCLSSAAAATASNFNGDQNYFCVTTTAILDGLYATGEESPRTTA